MRIFIALVYLIISGCQQKHSFEEHEETKLLLEHYTTDIEVVEFLQKSNEGVGSEKFSTFVKWGVEYPERFTSIMNHKDISIPTLQLISYTISDIGYSKEYCNIYNPEVKGNNVHVIRKAILGCNYKSESP